MEQTFNDVFDMRDYSTVEALIMGCHGRVIAFVLNEYSVLDGFHALGSANPSKNLWVCRTDHDNPTRQFQNFNMYINN